MSKQKKLQLPITEEMEIGLKQKSKQYGFSSTNEFVRVCLNNIVNNNIILQFMPGPQARMP